jgi:hypothetical protein
MNIELAKPPAEELSDQPAPPPQSSKNRIRSIIKKKIGFDNR